MIKKRVFIVDEHLSSRQNGVGTYMQCLLDCMKGLDVEVNFLSFNSEEKDFSFYEREGCTYTVFLYVMEGVCWKVENYVGLF